MKKIIVFIAFSNLLYAQTYKGLDETIPNSGYFEFSFLSLSFGIIIFTIGFSSTFRTRKISEHRGYWYRRAAIRTKSTGLIFMVISFLLTAYYVYNFFSSAARTVG